MFTNLIKKLSKSRKGFTLVELIIVMAILGILASIAIPSFNGVRERSIVKAEASEAASIIHEARIMETENGDGVALTDAQVTMANNNADMLLGGGGDDPYTVTWTTAANAAAADAVAAASATVMPGFSNAGTSCELEEQQ